VPHDRADPTDAFGLLQRCIPRRIGKNEGPKARVLVSSLRCWLFAAFIKLLAQPRTWQHRPHTHCS
jgi:hypothetical protein